jgi:hypothetical protein
VTAGHRVRDPDAAPGTPTIWVTRGTGIGQRVDGSIESIREAVVALESPR